MARRIPALALPSGAMALGSKRPRPASYEDILALPEHLVGEIVESIVRTSAIFAFTESHPHSGGDRKRAFKLPTHLSALSGMICVVCDSRHAP
jgi:hypothetical protein